MLSYVSILHYIKTIVNYFFVKKFSKPTKVIIYRARAYFKIRIYAEKNFMAKPTKTVLLRQVEGWNSRLPIRGVARLFEEQKLLSLSFLNLEKCEKGKYYLFFGEQVFGIGDLTGQDFRLADIPTLENPGRTVPGSLRPYPGGRCHRWSAPALSHPAGRQNG